MSTRTIPESPDEHIVENDMIDIGFYASIGYPRDRSLAIDGGIDTPPMLSPPLQYDGGTSSPRTKAEKRNATVNHSPFANRGGYAE